MGFGGVGEKGGEEHELALKVCPGGGAVDVPCPLIAAGSGSGGEAGPRLRFV